MVTDATFCNILDSEINKKGSLSLYDYMVLCLQHPEYGYYTDGTPLGRSGDFITAPEMSQLFGETIAFFLLSSVDALFPSGYSLCECGAGRGTLMADILRILNKKSPPQNCYSLESNVHLKQEQIQNIPAIKHIECLKDLPDEPIFFVANEFFDALPIHAYKVAGSEKFEMHVTGQNGSYELSATHRSINDTPYHKGIYETSPDAHQIMQEIAQHITHNKGAALICDYGYTNPRDTLSFRGYHKHKVTDGLSHPFRSDLTADVDFSSLQNIARHHGAAIYPVMTQKAFLENMHISLRLHKLLHKCANDSQKELMITAVQKMLDFNEMGEKFKFLFISSAQDDIYPFNLT